MNAKVLLASILAFSIMAGGIFAVSESSDGAPSGTAIIGVPYSSTITSTDDANFVTTAWTIQNFITNGNPDNFSWILKSSLSWMSVTPTSSSVVTLGGTPTELGTFNVTLTALFEDEGGTLIGNKTYVFTLVVSNPIILDFENPPMLDMLTGQQISYAPQTNITAIITMEAGGPAWITFVDGVLSGTAPEVESATTYTVTLKATAGDQTAYQVVTIKVTPVLGIDSSFPGTQFIAGTLYSYSPMANIEGAVFQISENPPWIAWDPETKTVKGTVPGDITDVSSITYKLTASTQNPNQTAIQVVTVNIVPVLSFTTIPTADMIITPVEGMSGTFQFTPTGDNIRSLVWDFGDGTTSEEWAPVHTYADGGEYTVTLTASNELGVDTYTQVLTVDLDGEFWQPYYIYGVGLIIGILMLIMIGARLSKNKRRR